MFGKWTWTPESSTIDFSLQSGRGIRSFCPTGPMPHGAALWGAAMTPRTELMTRAEHVSFCRSSTKLRYAVDKNRISMWRRTSGTKIWHVKQGFIVCRAAAGSHKRVRLCELDLTSKHIGTHCQY